MYYLFRIVILFSLLSILQSCKEKEVFNYLNRTYSAEEIQNVNSKLERFFYSGLGHFSNKATADTSSSPILFEQELISVPIWKKRSGEYWAYIVWIKANFETEVLASAVFEFLRKDRETFIIRMYEVPNADKYILDWKIKSPLADLEPKDLIWTYNCEFLFKEDKDGNFVSIPTEAPCKKQFSSTIQFFDLDWELMPEGLKSHTRFYDEDKNLIIQHPPKPFANGFRRLKKEEAKYLNEN